MAARYPARVWLALLTIYVVWGSTFIALAIIVRDLPPFLSMAIRHLAAGALLLAWALPRGDREGDRLGQGPGPRGLRLRRASLPARPRQPRVGAEDGARRAWPRCSVGSIPIWMALLDRVVFGKRLRSSAYVGFALGFVGLGFLIDPFGSGSVDRVGAIVIVFGALAWSAGSLYSRGAALPKRPLVAAGLGAVCGGVLLLVVSIAGGELGEATWTPESLLALGYLVVVGSLVGFTAYVWLLRAAPVSLVATYAYVNPIVAVFLGWLLLGEAVTLQMAVAGAAIVVAVALILRASGAAVEPGRGLLRRRAQLPRPLPESTH